MSDLSFRLFDHWSQNPAAHRLGSALFHFVWQGAAIAVIASLAVLLLRGARPQVRYGLLVLALGVMCVCPAVTFVVSTPSTGATAAAASRGEEFDRTEIDIAASSMHGSIAIGREETEAKAVPAEELVDEMTSVFSEFRSTRPLPLEPVALETRPGTVNAWLTGAQSWLNRHRHEFVAAWGSGVLLLTLRLAAGLFGAERVRRRQVIAARESLQQMTASLIARMRIKRPVRVLESALAEVPTLVGWLRPVILLPATAICGLTPTQLESLLAHELAHVRRHDYLVNLWQTVVETILFYHPAVWWISRRIREEREHCCDDVAVTLCGDRIAYARALATMEEMRAPVPRWAVAAGGGSLGARIRRIVGHPEPTGRQRPAVAALIVGAILLLLTGGTMNVPRLLSADEAANGLATTIETKSSPVDADETAKVSKERHMPGTESPTASTSVAGETELQRVTGSKPDERAGKRTLVSVLAHNRSWLDPEASPPDRTQPFETLSYSFLTVREDVRESCAFNHIGESVIEVSHDGQGKMKERVGARFIGQNSSEYASANRGGKFASIHFPPERSRDRPFGESLRQYARIGCQFDLPLFRYRDELDSANVEVSDGEWKGKPCEVVTVTGLRPNIYFGCGTMLGHTSWSYVHHIRPSREVFYVDTQRHVVLHETLDLSRRDSQKKFEIDFPEYTEISPGQWVPLAIRAESPGYFTCEYRFQVVAGSHWLLKDVVSWFDPNEKSRGVVEDVQVNGGRDLLDDALRQVSASRALFGGKESSAEPVRLSTVPFVLNDVVHVGPYDLQVVRSERWQVAVRVSTKDRQAPARVPIGVLDRNGRLLFAPTVTLADVDGKRSGEVELHGSLVWNDARSLVVPVSQEGVTAPQTVQAIPFRWNEPMSVNIPEARKGQIRSEFGETKPRDARTCVHRIEIVRREDGTAHAVLDVASIDGTHEFYFDVSVAVVEESGTLLASGNQSGTLRVESRPVEQRYEIDLGPIPEGSNPRYLVVGIAPGNIIRAPAGSMWMTFEQTPPFDVASKQSGRGRSQNREEVRAGEKTNLKRTRPDAEGRFTITFDNPLSRGDTKRWTLDPEQNQVVFQMSVKNGDGRLQEKIFKQLPARKQGGYRVDVHVKPELIEHSQASVVFVTIQPDHDAWVNRFFHEGKGTSYKGIWSGESRKLPDMAVDETTTGWLAEGEKPAAPASEAPTAASSKESDAAKSPTAAEILQIVVDKNRFWLDPQPKSLSYTVIGGKPGAEGARETTNRVRIAGDKVRWDLDTEFEPLPNSKRKPEPMNYSYVFTPDGTVCLRAPPKVDKDVLSRKRGTHAFRQGMLFSTALHVMALHGVPKTCRIVEEKPETEGREVVIEGEFRNARGAFGLGMDHVQLGKIDWRIDQFRIHVRLPDGMPLREEYFDPTTGALTAMSVEFGPETLKIGDHVVPTTARFVSKRDVPAGRAAGFKEWILEARFQNAEGNWLLEKATNSQDGVVVKQLRVTDVSTAQVPPEVFDPQRPGADEKPAADEKKENEKRE